MVLTGVFHLFLLPPLVEFDRGFDTREVLDIAIATFALILLGLSVSAYRKTRLRRLLVVSVAFGLFAVEVVIRQFDDFVLSLDPQTEQVVVAVMEFFILLLFFLAIVVREPHQTAESRPEAGGQRPSPPS